MKPDTSEIAEKEEMARGGLLVLRCSALIRGSRDLVGTKAEGSSSKSGSQKSASHFWISQMQIPICSLSLVRVLGLARNPCASLSQSP